MFAEAIRAARERKAWSQRDLAEASGVSRKHIADVEAGANVSVRVIEKLAAALELQELPIASFRLTARSERLPNLTFLRDRASRIIKSANELVAELYGERGRVLTFPDSKPRILFDDEQEKIDELRKSIDATPHQQVEWRTAFRGKGTHKAQRVADAAAGAGAEPMNALDDDVILREIPEHYWELGARIVMRVRGDSLSGLGYVDRDLLFVKPSATAANNDVIVCSYQNLVFVKVLRRKARKAWLLSANSEFSPIRIDPAESFRIHGLVIGRSGYARPGSELPDPIE